MRCIFCKASSVLSRSVEHIIPESLGNTTQVLPLGVVCDKCNQYFSANVEKPFLESAGIIDLRSFQFVPSKKGRIPPTIAYMNGKFEVKVHPQKNGPIKAYVDVDRAVFEKVLKGEISNIVLSCGALPRDPSIITRFLAKVAVEALAQRLLIKDGGLDYIVDETQFDHIRNHARIGDPKEWAYHSRRIYDSNERRTDIHGETFQVVHEYDLFLTPLRELYLVLALFGLELAINIGGPEVDGYLDWLHANNNVSPLHIGQNKNVF